MQSQTELLLVGQVVSVDALSPPVGGVAIEHSINSGAACGPICVGCGLFLLNLLATFGLQIIKTLNLPTSTYIHIYTLSYIQKNARLVDKSGGSNTPRGA